MRKRDIAIAIGGALGAAVAVKLLTRSGGVEWESFAHIIAHSDRSKFANIDGVRVHYQAFGDAANPAVVLIHGYIASTYVWKTTAPLLADAGFYVIALDLIGFGFSDKPARFDYSIQSQAEIVRGLMRHLDIDSATLVGSSYGGAVALTIALDHPERVEKLVLVNSVINDEQKDHPILRLVARRGIGELLTPFIADSKFFLRRRMRHTLARANHHLITKDRIDAIRRPVCTREGHRSLLATSRAWNAARIEKNLRDINTPTLIIWGDQDKVIPIKNGHKLHYNIAGARMVVFNDCGHIPPEEKPGMFAELVRNFCRRP